LAALDVPEGQLAVGLLAATLVAGTRALLVLGLPAALCWRMASRVALVMAAVINSSLVNRLDTDEAERRAIMVVNIQKDSGCSLEQAERLVNNTLVAIAKRDINDDAIKKLIQIFAGGAQS
jgi:hypothetical protein